MRLAFIGLSGAACLALAACNTAGNNTTANETAASVRIDAGKALIVLSQGVDAQAKLASVLISTGVVKGAAEQTVAADVQKERQVLDAATTAYHLTGADPSDAVAEVSQLMTDVSSLLPANPS